MNDKPDRPALRYYGGKWLIGKWIISHFPSHQSYIEPCGGAASVLLQKDRSALETYNDLDGSVVNFFRVLRDEPDALIHSLNWTPWAREEYEMSLQTDGRPIENARRFWVWCWMGIGGKWGGWRSITSPDSRNGVAWPQDTINLDHLKKVAERFRGVQIEHIDSMECVRKYANDESLIYIDPPYLPETRERPGRYAFEWTEGQHIEAAEVLRNCKGSVVISGYACPLYADLYEAYGWTRRDRESATNGGGKRVESLWLSPQSVSRAMNDLPIFNQGKFK